jgi:RNA polymerase sigma-70 factor, ECF subfamily
VTNRQDGLFSVVGMTDTELVARAREGETDAWQTLVEDSYDACWRYALRMMGERADAEDVVQETFVRAMAALPLYREQDRFRAWLFTILVNQCRNALIARQRRQRRFVASDAWEADDVRLGASQPEPLADEALTRAVARLDTASREAILLRYGEGMEFADIARLTGASVSALKMRVSRALVRLRHTLGEDAR